MSESEDPREFLDRVTTITNQLLALGVVIPEVRIVHKILSQMTTTFMPLQMTIRSLLQARPSEQHTIAFLRQQFTGVTNPNKSKGKNHGALNTEHKKYQQAPTFKAGIICYYCGKEGHYESNCRLKRKQKNPGQNRNQGGYRQPYRGANQNGGNQNNPGNQNQNGGNQNNPGNQNQNGGNGQNRNQIQQSQGQAGQRRPPLVNRPQGQAGQSANNVEEAMILEEVLQIGIQDQNSTNWILDSGCTTHMTSNAKLLHNIRPLAEEIIIRGALDKEVRIAKFEGDSYLDTRWRIKLQNVLLVPGIRRNLISARKLAKSGATIVTEGDTTEVYIRNELAMEFVQNQDRLYELTLDQEIHECNHVAHSNDEEVIFWHQALGHLSVSGLKKLQNQGLIPTDLKGDETIECVACEKGKSTRKAFNDVQKQVKTTKIGELIHSDVCGPITPATRTGKKYFVTYTDDFTRYSQTYFMEKKSEQIENFREYKAMLKIQKEADIIKIRTDSGGEYTSNQFEDLLKSEGIEHESKPPRTSQWRGESERLNRTLMDKTRAMLKAKNLPNDLWAEALRYATL